MNANTENAVTLSTFTDLLGVSRWWCRDLRPRTLRRGEEVFEVFERVYTNDDAAPELLDMRVVDVIGADRFDSYVAALVGFGWRVSS